MLGIIAALAVAGCVAGFLAGLLGVGGGIIFVPVLFFLLKSYLGMDPQLAITVATATSLGCMIPTTLSSCISHYRRGNMDLQLLKRWLPILILGVISGTVVSAFYGGLWLSVLFGIIIITASLNMLFRAKAPPLRDSLPGTAGQSAMAMFVSFFSVMLGIGGGTLTVPLLTSCNFPARRAIGTASAIGLIICLPGAVSTLIFSQTPQIEHNLLFVGKISFMIVGCIVPFSALTAPVGVMINRRIDPVLLKRLFGIMMILTGLKMLHSAFF